MNEHQIKQLEKAKLHAKSKGGACLSETYINTDLKLLWQCSEPTHSTWEATNFKVVNSGRWCPICSRSKTAQKLVNKSGLQKAQDIALSKGGVCLSTEYRNNKQKLVWHCGNDKHEPWESVYTSVVLNGHWCPSCARGKIGENKTRKVFESYFKQPFPSERPTWNMNPWSGWPLELDGYCSIFNVAFEHDGEHHAESGRYSKSNKVNDFLYQQFKDEQKRKNCLKQGVTLIHIPILKQRDRKVFGRFLENIAKSCERAGLTMEFTPEQLVKLEQDFYAV